MELKRQIEIVIYGLNYWESERLKESGYTNECFFNNGVLNQESLTRDYTYWFREGKKYVKVNCGGSGVFMIRNDGEIFNIKAYGVPDKNKKIKADLGNIKQYLTESGKADLEKIQFLHSKRYNYLR